MEFFRELRLPPDTVDGLVPSRLNDPRTRKLRDACLPPLVHGGGKGFLRCFLGQEGMGESDESLVNITRSELERIMGLKDKPFFRSISRWPASMAQFTVGHEKRMTEIEERNARLRGVSLIGNSYRGMGLPDCVKMGKEAAARIVSTPVPVPVLAAR